MFDSEDENKFVYSDIHAEFREHIEALITSNLGEVGVTVAMFYESCEKGAQSRDINRAVFERMLAMEDFSTFKRIMVKLAVRGLRRRAWFATRLNMER